MIDTAKACAHIRDALEEMGHPVHYCQTASWWPNGHSVADPLDRHVELLLFALDQLDPHGATVGTPYP